MEALESYLASDYLAEKQEIENIDHMLQAVAATFATVFDGVAWPYEYRPATAITGTGTVEAAKIAQAGDKNNAVCAKKEVDLSQGTVAMVLTVSGRMLGRCRLPKGTSKRLIVDPVLEESWLTGLENLSNDLEAKKSVVSNSFGDNNPITLSHISEFVRLLDPEQYSYAIAPINAGIAEAKGKLATIIEDHFGGDSALLTPDSPRGKYCTNAFVPLRAVRAARDCTLSTEARAQHQRFFESTLHDQLSFSAIPDSRFDPAELLFCVEGLLLCAREAVDASLLDRVLEVLADKQNTSAHWRPAKPFLASETGFIMLPVSVEGANSLMRSIAIMDSDRTYDTFTSKSLPLVKRFWGWLRARAVHFELKQRQCIGWHSEHVNDPRLIHIWDTSQVAEFMISFREMMERHIANKTLRLSRLPLKKIKPDPEHDKKTKDEQWEEKIKSYEPSLGEESASKVYHDIRDDFVSPWAKTNEPTNYSMVLFGPPGTGKTTVAENIAEVLCLPLITVTVSDFLGTGGANVEARAKAIFQTLEAQDKCVIFFDEIDSFLLDRDSKLYREQDSLFQFLTPGMLTKVNDLRRRKSCLFIIATNYYDRIDPAVMRTGRIDKKYLVPLPNKARRIEIMQRFGLRGPINEDKLAVASLFLGFPDIKGATRDAGGASAKEADLILKLKSRPPSTSIEAYVTNRLSKSERFPAAEFRGLVALAAEVNETKQVSDTIRRLVDGEQRGILIQNGFEELLSSATAEAGDERS